MYFALWIMANKCNAEVWNRLMTTLENKSKDDGDDDNDNDDQ